MKSVKLLLVASIVSVICLLSACNTVQGVGKDVQKGGQELQKAAVQNK